jgi:hypothetical protein
MTLISDAQNASMNSYETEHHFRKIMADIDPPSRLTFFLEKGFASFSVGSLGPLLWGA